MGGGVASHRLCLACRGASHAPTSRTSISGRLFMDRCIWRSLMRASTSGLQQSSGARVQGGGLGVRS